MTREDRERVLANLRDTIDRCIAEVSAEDRAPLARAIRDIGEAFDQALLAIDRGLARLAGQLQHRETTLDQRGRCRREPAS
jgi:hypothetical protein